MIEPARMILSANTKECRKLKKKYTKQSPSDRAKLSFGWASCEYFFEYLLETLSR
jgi:hypothetical protein